MRKNHQIIEGALNAVRRGSFSRRQILSQFRQNFVDLRSPRHRLDFWIVSDCELMVLTERLEHLQHFCILLLRKEIYLQIEMIALIRLKIAAILTHENKQREENRFQRDDRGQELEWERVEGRLAMTGHVDPEPKGEPDHVKNDEPHFSRVRGDGISNTGRKGSLRKGAVFHFGNCLDVAGCRRGRLHTSMLFRSVSAGKPGVSAGEPEQ